MVFTLHFCASCGSAHIRRNGSAAGHAKAVQYEQVDNLLSERVSQRSIVRLTGVSRMMVAKRAKKSSVAAASPATASPEEGPKKTLGSP